MRINVKRDADFAVSHQVLQRFRVHACLRLIAAIGVAANMRCNIRHLHPVNLIILADHAVEAVFPVQRDQRHTVLIEVQEAAVAVHERFPSRFLFVLDDRLKAPGDLLGDRNLPLSGIGLGGLDQPHLCHNYTT